MSFQVLSSPLAIRFAYLVRCGRRTTSARSLTGIPADYSLPAAGSVLIGDKGSLVIPHVAEPKLFPEAQFAERNLEKKEDLDHYTQWADACRGVGETTSHFDYAAPLPKPFCSERLVSDIPTRTHMGFERPKDYQQQRGAKVGFESVSKRLGTNLGFSDLR